MILIVSVCSEKLSEEEFVRPIAHIVNKDYRITHYNEIKVSKIKNFNGIIICGTALKDNKYLKDINKFKWIKRVNMPILGICAGMQIIALQFGARLIKNTEIGSKEVKTEIKNHLFLGKFNAYELHENSLNNLKNFNIIAKSKNSIQAIKHKTRDIYGIMFHPEVRNENIVKKFLSV